MILSKSINHLKVIVLLRRLSFLKDQRGFTAFELIIAIQLSLVVIGLGYVSYLFSVKLVNKWQKKIVVENSLSQISTTLTKSLDQLRVIHQAGPEELSGLQLNGDTLQVNLQDHVYLNGETVGDETLLLISAEFEYLLNSNEGGKPHIKMSKLMGSNLNKIRAVKCFLTLKNSGQSCEVEILSRLIKYRYNITD